MPAQVHPPLLTSAALTAPHGFSTRAGGVSAGPYRSLNLGFQVGDDPTAVRENHARLAQLGGFPLPSLRVVSQVHGARVLEASDTPPAEPWTPLGEADAVWTGAQGVVVGVRTADCVPILIADPVGRRVAAVHSGWRGTEARISARTVETLGAHGSVAGNLRVAIGPHIRGCCYAVSAELAAAFRAGFGPAVADERGGQWYLRLAVAVRQSLEASGVPEARIEEVDGCTSCDPERFYSHRRDGAHTGRHLSFIRCSF